MPRLSDFTTARVDLGRAGDSLPTSVLLDLRLAQARARDAVHTPLETLSLAREMAELGWSATALSSQVGSRKEYLLRPDLGRTLSAASQEVVHHLPKPKTVFAVADGLSATAVHRHAIPLLKEIKLTGEIFENILLITNGRVAISDHLGELLEAEVCVLLIGERPGLSSPDSLGMYLTWRPRRGCTDANRNCVSNIHGHGLSYQSAARKVAYLLAESRRLRISGVALKDRAGLLTNDAMPELTD